MDLTKLKEIFEIWDSNNNKIYIKNDVFKTIESIKNHFHFDMLKSISAIDNQDSGIELIYHLYSTSDDENVLVSITVFNETESISELFDSAIADEREIYDLFGVKFNGNKELSRIYLPEGWIGHPLKKDYIENDERLKWND